MHIRLLCKATTLCALDAVLFSHGYAFIISSEQKINEGIKKSCFFVFYVRKVPDFARK